MFSWKRSWTFQETFFSEHLQKPFSIDDILFAKLQIRTAIFEQSTFEEVKHVHFFEKSNI